jgi:hypothetical protein
MIRKSIRNPPYLFPTQNFVGKYCMGRNFAHTILAHKNLYEKIYESAIAELFPYNNEFQISSAIFSMIFLIMFQMKSMPSRYKTSLTTTVKKTFLF